MAIEHTGRWERIEHVTRSGKTLYVCLVCGKVQPWPDKACSGREHTYPPTLTRADPDEEANGSAGR